MSAASIAGTTTTSRLTTKRLRSWTRVSTESGTERTRTSNTNQITSELGGYQITGSPVLRARATSDPLSPRHSRTREDPHAPNAHKNPLRNISELT
jgi:hypothetical protein